MSPARRTAIHVAGAVDAEAAGQDHHTEAAPSRHGLGEASRAGDVGIDHVGGLSRRARNPAQRRAMDDGLHVVEAIFGAPVAQIDEAVAGPGVHVSRRLVVDARVEAVDADHVGAGRHQLVDQVRTDEAGSPGDEHLQRWAAVASRTSS